MPLDPNDAESNLLDALRFEDDQWLWEVVWALNGRFPLHSLAERVAVAREVVLRLYRRGDVELWRGLWPDGAAEPLGPEAVGALAVEDLPWRDPEHAGILVVIRRRTKHVSGPIGETPGCRRSSWRGCQRSGSLYPQGA
jgi:hypothetical protein